jgi:DNA-binding XRE family transcriptional regulator
LQPDDKGCAVAKAKPRSESAQARVVGQAVADRRMDLGLTQKELAEKAGLAMNTAALLERGRTFPRAANARKIEDALEWPRGTIGRIRSGGAAPKSPPARTRAARTVSPTSVPAAPPSSSAQALAIANGVVGIAATCMKILVRFEGSDPEAGAGLRELDAQLLGLETLIAASLPQAESFDDTMSTLAELHRHRDAIRQAADRLQTGA